MESQGTDIGSDQQQVLPASDQEEQQEQELKAEIQTVNDEGLEDQPEVVENKEASLEEVSTALTVEVNQPLFEGHNDPIVEVVSPQPDSVIDVQVEERKLEVKEEEEVREHGIKVEEIKEEELLTNEEEERKPEVEKEDADERSGMLEIQTVKQEEIDEEREEDKKDEKGESIDSTYAPAVVTDKEQEEEGVLSVEEVVETLENHRENSVQETAKTSSSEPAKKTCSSKPRRLPVPTSSAASKPTSGSSGRKSLATRQLRGSAPESNMERCSKQRRSTSATGRVSVGGEAGIRSPSNTSSEDPGSNEVFHPHQQSPLRTYIHGQKSGIPTKIYRVANRTPDCNELQHVTKATPMPESRIVEVKQTAASRARLQKLQEEAAKALEVSNENQYLTPLQRKEAEVKELRRLLHEAYQVITEREEELEAASRQRSLEVAAAVRDKEARIGQLQAEIDRLSLGYKSLTEEHGDLQRREEKLLQQVALLRAEIDERERKHQAYYLQTYHKGRESARFERLDELEKLAVQEPDKVSVEELVEKLELTQQDLHKWQSIKLEETYSESEQPATEADAKLRFLRDSMFHYLTDKDRDQGQQHLTAMIGIFNFTDVQMNSIMKSVAERRKKGKI